MHIVGGAGSGKTTLARQLGRHLGVEPVDLDAAFSADREALAAGDRWIVEGVYLFDIEPLLRRAELIVWLDLKPRTCIRRIVTRHFWLSATGRNRHRGLRLLWSFARGQPGYYTELAREPTGPRDFEAITRALTLERLGPHSDKVVTLRTPTEVRRWRRALEGRGRL